MKRVLIAFFTVIICFILQTTVFQFITLGGILPNILIIITIFYGMMRGDVTGLVVGFFSGLLIDIFFGSFIGLNAALYMYTGYLSGKFCLLYRTDDYKLPAILCILGDLLYSLTYYLFMFLLRGRFDFSFYLKNIILPELVYTFLIAVVIYPIFLFVHIKLNNQDQDRGMKFV